MPSAPHGREQRAGDARGERDAAPNVDRVLTPLVGDVHVKGDHDQGEDCKRQVDEEEPAPAEVLGDEAAGCWPDDGRDSERRTQHSLVLAALARRDDVADDGLRQRHDEPHAGSLDEAREHQEPEVRGDPAQRRADGEDDNASHVQRLAAVNVGELAGDRHDDGRGQHGGDWDPAVVGDAAELRDDGRQGRRDQRQVEGRDQRPEHEPREDGDDPTVDALPRLWLLLLAASGDGRHTVEVPPTGCVVGRGPARQGCCAAPRRCLPRSCLLSTAGIGRSTPPRPPVPPVQRCRRQSRSCAG